MTMLASKVWVDVCPLEKLIPGRGVCALVGGFQVAVFRIVADEVYALSNYDPFSRAFVLSRGIVGSKAERLKVASPVYKQGFDLETGVCLDDPAQRLPVHEVAVVGGLVSVRLRAGGARADTR